ncbi:hypothetical protein CHS0354_021209 [Potamilus streckersoni]|nr:hypothetical protein CHS0354_021209 [Potamilus streckersoni]
MTVITLYKRPGLSAGKEESVCRKLSELTTGHQVENLQTEICFYVLSQKEALTTDEFDRLSWILQTPFQEKNLSDKSFLQIENDSKELLIEIGPRLNFSTPFSTNAVSICKSISLEFISRIEFSLRYLIHFHENKPCDQIEQQMIGCLHDRMTHCRYLEPIRSFDLEVKSEPIYEVDIMDNGRSALEKANKDMGLAFDDWDLDYYTKLFKEQIKRNPTSVECFDLAQSNSEHSRHWFFRGKLVIDGEECPDSLFKMVMSTQNFSNNNNVIKFSDNSSGIFGYEVSVLKPMDPTEASIIAEKTFQKRHIIFTAETHNFPTGVAPFPGATTGTGGRIRDVHCTGRGAHVVAGTAGYSFGNLLIPGYDLPWEEKDFEYPENFARPLEICIEASNGASDYGNKFGEPLLAGFARSFGQIIGCGERREYIKPIMFSGGIGQLQDEHIFKQMPEKGMEVAKIGGPVYRIGVGGGAASSVQVQGDNKIELDFGAVQRGDAEMEQKLNRLIRACIEIGVKNPICSIHDQGAGGNGNVLKEIVEPAGAVIRAQDFQLGDPTLTILELWGAEYQETNAILLHKENTNVLCKIGQRERCPVCFVGTVTGDGRIRLEDFDSKSKTSSDGAGDSKGQHSGVSNPDLNKKSSGPAYPVDLELEHVLGKMPQKMFQLSRLRPNLTPLSLPENLQVLDALHRVLRLPAVASKRYLMNKVDRCVTGLVAQQQCIGPLHTPIADVAVTALTFLDKVGSATAIGEQPIKGLIDPGCGARMSVGEALTNLVFARVSSLKDVKCSANWMWPAKLPGEGASLYDACKAMCDIMQKIGIAVDGGKDSLSMAARVGDSTVKAPGTLVVSVYAGCPDITATVTPEFKCRDGIGLLFLVDCSHGKHRLGGTALAQCYKQIGNEAPDLDHPETLCRAFNIIQELIREKKIISGHDISDGGIVTCALEMAFAGNCGFEICFEDKSASALEILFAEELGFIIEVRQLHMDEILQRFKSEDVPCYLIGHCCDPDKNAEIHLSVNGVEVLSEKMVILKDIWEETSFQLEKLQANPHCVKQEQEGLKARKHPPYNVTFDPDIVCIMSKEFVGKPSPKVAVLREEGSNSDREMAAALHMAGFEVWDVHMQDLCSRKIALDQFQGLVFVGGFSYADVLGSAKGWAATSLFNNYVNTQLRAFKERQNTFSLGVCNGCQLMGLLGWVAHDSDVEQGGQGVLLDHNDSERFECRFVTVKVNKSPAIMFQGMTDTIFGMWSAHGEGKMVFKSPDIYQKLKEKNLIPVSYVDDDGKPTITYPFNPNGSPDGVAALCSEDGRHLAIMPHPERCFLPWQCPWMPFEWQHEWDVSPWFIMFQNAFNWCIKHL